MTGFANMRRARNQAELKRQQDELGLYFWRQGRLDGSDVLLSKHITLDTPHWCSWCGWASDCEECFRGPHGQLSLPGLGD